MATLADPPVAATTATAGRLAGGWPLTAGLALLAGLAALAGLGFGATGVALWPALGKLVAGQPLDRIEALVLIDIRLPRVATGLAVGAALGLSGAVMQGLFRNPLADPGIVGVGAGAGLGAIVAIVLGGALPAGLAAALGPHLVPVAAFAGGWGATLLLYRIATRGGHTSVATMLLAGIALAALAGALTGLLVFAADDDQLRDLTFWGLGSLAGASWAKAAAALPLIGAALLVGLALGRGLNALALGEPAARHIGIRVERLKSAAILCVAAATGAAVAISGGIGFVGIVVPHLLRLASGPDHRALLANAALLGAALLVLADLAARSLVAPAELPIGIVTAVLGAPVFLWVLLRRQGAAGF